MPTPRPTAHAFWEDRDTPRCCRRCHLPAANYVHSAAALREQAAAERAAADRPDYVDPSRARHIRSSTTEAPAEANASRRTHDSDPTQARRVQHSSEGERP